LDRRLVREEIYYTVWFNTKFLKAVRCLNRGKREPKVRRTFGSGGIKPDFRINNRELLFCVDTARKIFKKVFHETELRFAFDIQGLSFEGDLLKFYIRPENGLELPDIMKWLKQTFAQRYNREMGRTGHIWGDRYWSLILEGEPPEGGTGGRAEASANGVRPPRGKNEAAPCFSPISPRPAAPAPG
jgi:REP element-mobilizing transposase RayT